MTIVVTKLLVRVFKQLCKTNVKMHVVEHHPVSVCVTMSELIMMSLDEVSNFNLDHLVGLELLNLSYFFELVTSVVIALLT